MGKGLEINKRGIAQMMREMQREFAKHPIRVPIEGEPSTSLPGLFAGSTSVCNGPDGQLLDRQISAGCIRVFTDRLPSSAGGIGFRSLHESLDTTTPGGRLVFHVFAALAEFIAELIVEGTREGLDAARARGQRLGRPPALTPRADPPRPPAARQPGPGVSLRSTCSPGTDRRKA